MKKNLFLRLCLMMVVVLSLFSCRQDFLPEKETYHNSGAFQLKSNRISLNESKHKAKLVPELEKVEAKFKEKSFAFGKIVNYGDGVSIDTDDVTYIENGPNYHTYTFNIKRENAPADAPVENLVLSPLTDGTYRELLITYNFTPQEKQTLMNGGFVDTKGKTTVTELASGTYSGALSKTSCSYETVTINIPCTSSDHHMPGQDCDMTGNDAPRSFTMVALVCGADTSLGDDGSSGGGVSVGPTGGLGGSEDDGSGNTDFPSNQPGDCNGGLTAPQTPGYDISDGGCGGIPTQINLPHPSNDPCIKTKRSITAANTILKNPDVQTKMDAVLKGKINAPNEWSIAIGQKPNNEYEVTAPKEGGKTSSTSPNSQLTNPFVGNGHSHAGLPGDPSGGDIYALLERVLIYPEYKFTYTYGVNNGQSEVYALVLNDKAAALQFLIDYPKIDNYDPKTHSIKTKGDLGEAFHKMKFIYGKDKSGDTSGENYQSYAVATAYILEKFNSGISVAKVDNNRNLKKINASFEKGGIMGERPKISKCP